MRYEEVTRELLSLLDEIRDTFFPELVNARIKCLFDLRKRKRGGKIVLASILRTNDLLRHLTAEEAHRVEGYDYIMVVDKTAWEVADKNDRLRLLRHELRHTEVDMESLTQPYRIIDHDIADFTEEIQLNQDDVSWAQRLSTVVADTYAQREDVKQESASHKKQRHPNPF